MEIQNFSTWMHLQFSENKFILWMSFLLEQPDNKLIYTAVLVLTNLLQVVNFSINFILYCAVHAYFR